MQAKRTNDLHKLDVYRCALELYRLVGVIVGRFPHGEADRPPQPDEARLQEKELIVALDCVEIDRLAPAEEVAAAQELADRVSAMLTKLIRSV